MVFVEVPPTIPKNNSTFVPAYCDTSIKPLFIVTLVWMRLAASEKTFVPFNAAATESLAPSPCSMKSNDNEVAFVGIVIGNQAYAGEFDGVDD
ncbi:MAG TPA: hypothetical protein VIK53_05945 [Verrucomicrobiae bacterium]